MYTIDVIQIYDITMYDIYVIYTYTIYIYIYISGARGPLAVPHLRLWWRTAGGARGRRG